MSSVIRVSIERFWFDGRHTDFDTVVNITRISQHSRVKSSLVVDFRAKTLDRAKNATRGLNHPSMDSRDDGRESGKQEGFLIMCVCTYYSTQIMRERIMIYAP